MKLDFESNEMPILGWIIIGIILISQALFLFIKSKNERRNAWVWGILGLIQFPLPTIIYYITRKNRNR